MDPFANDSICECGKKLKDRVAVLRHQKRGACPLFQRQVDQDQWSKC